MTHGQERRRARRRQTLDEHGIAGARVRPGHDVELVDVSAGGALIETTYRLFPGSFVELQLVAGARSATIRCRVLRCTVARLRATSIRYRGAVGFERDLSWFVDNEGTGYAVLDPEIRTDRAARGDATQLRP